jgi:hypothetical protein
LKRSFIYLLAAATALACGRPVPALPAGERTLRAQRGTYSDPRWQDLFDPAPELMIVVRPQALRRDAVYGPLLRRVIDLARERSPVVAATRALDAMAEADEVVVGVRAGARKGEDDLVGVVTGVRADLDPAKLVDEEGRRLWGPGPSGAVRELVHMPERSGGVDLHDGRFHVRDQGDGSAAEQTSDASLFELRERTWVIATGASRERARDVFSGHSRSGGGLPVNLDPNALALVRVSGPALVAHIHALRSPGLLAPVGHKLEAVTAVLSPGDDADIRTTLSYGDEAAVAAAAATVAEAIEALGARLQDYFWLRSATVRQSHCCVVVATPLPPPVVAALVPPAPAATSHGRAPH